MLCGICLLTACLPQSVALAPTFPPFPTTTPGQSLIGVLPTGAMAPVMGNLQNPATAVAFANRPTPTPNLGACPVLDGDAEWGRKQATTADAHAAILDYVQDGGSVNGLRDGIRIRWQALGESGFVRDDFDLTGEGTPDIVIGWRTPEDVGELLVVGCRDGQYVIRDSAEMDSDQPPILVFVGEMNNAAPAELVYADELCDADANCVYETYVWAWDGYSGQFRNLLTTILNTLEIPELRDIDTDAVTEIVVNLRENGNTVTGPLRQGVMIYDWDGNNYPLSIIQLEAPRYYIQIAHEGDKQFSQLQMTNAAQTYTLLADATDLRYWYNNEADWLKAYALYRLLLTYATLEDPRLGDVALRLNTDFALTAALSADELPVYALMGYRFLDTLEVTGDLHAACLDTLQIVRERPEALDLLNRYGSRSPRYAELDLCPF